MAEAAFSTNDQRNDFLPFIWGIALVIWLIMIAVLPDPRPLAAPDWAVAKAQQWLGLSEPFARLAATLVLRGIGVGMIGILLSAALKQIRLSRAALVLLVGSPLLALVAKAINFRSFPASPQLEFIVIVAFFGGLFGLVLRRSWIALLVLVSLAGGLLVWGTATGITDELYESARATGQYVLDNSDDIPAGDEGFIELLERTFAYARNNSQGRDPIMPNQAAILALGVILGDDNVAWVGGRELSDERKRDRVALRNRMRIRDRNDLSRHFWVSASLAVLSDPDRAWTVGITKEMADSTPGGSGFSFVDMAANKTGIRFAVVATRDAQSARALQKRIARGVEVDDLFPRIDELPEGITAEDFQTKFGGLGGTETQRLFQLIDERIAALEALE